MMRRFLATVLALAMVCAPAAFAAGKRRPVGYVGKDMFLELLPSEDPIRVEVTIPRSLIKAICRGFEPPLDRIVCGLESIETLVLDLSGQTRDEVAKLIPDIDRNLQKEGWERLVLVRESDEQVRVLIHNDDEQINGLVVMVLDSREMVFVNIAGLIDLAAIQHLAREFDIPGLEHVEGIEDYEKQKDDD